MVSPPSHVLSKTDEKLLKTPTKYENCNYSIKQKSINRNGDLISDETIRGSATICIQYFTSASQYRACAIFSTALCPKTLYLNKTSLLPCQS